MSILLPLIGVMLWKTTSLFQEDKEPFLYEFSKKFALNVSRRAEDRIVSLKNKMASFVSHRESLISANKPFLGDSLFSSGYEPFLAIGVLQFDGQSWDIYWFEKNTQSTSSMNWPKDYEQKVLQTVPVGRLKESHFLHLENFSRDLTFGLAFPVSVGKNSTAVIVGLFSSESMSDLVSDFKGDMNEVYLLDEEGFIFAHPLENQIGKLSENQFQSTEHFTGESKNEQGDTLVTSYRKVGESNLYAVASTQKGMAFAILEDLFWQTLAIGLGFIILAFLFTSLFAKRFTQSLSAIKSVLRDFRKGQFQVNTNNEIGELEEDFEDLRRHLIDREKKWDSQKEDLVKKERTSALEELSGRLAREIKNPLLGVLGHAQLAKAKAEGELKNHIETIEKETRRVKELTENLIKFAQLEKTTFSRVDLHQIVNRILNFVNHQFSLKGIKLHKHFESTSEINANPSQLEYVLLNLMMNASQAVENSEQKEVHIYLQNMEKCVQLKVQDTGPGMNAEVKERIFEPFFTEEKSPLSDRRGIGLSASLGIMKNHGAKFYVESDLGSGTTFFMEFPFAEVMFSPVAESNVLSHEKNEEQTEGLLSDSNVQMEEIGVDKPDDTETFLADQSQEGKGFSKEQSSLSQLDWQTSEGEQSETDISHSDHSSEEEMALAIEGSEERDEDSALERKFSKMEELPLTSKEEDELMELKNTFFLEKFHVNIRKPRIKD